jgi:predicted nucleic acid-binding protein
MWQWAAEMSGIAVVKCFIDTNLFIYALTQSNKPQDSLKHQQVLELFEKLLPTAQIITSVQVVNECHFVLRRKFSLDESSVSHAIESGVLAIAQIASLELTDYHRASQLRQRHALSYWDSLVCASALRAGVNELYSEDMQHGLVIDQRLSIVNPFVSD